MDIRAERLKRAVSNSDMTQSEICKRAGITDGALSSYMAGRYFPKQKALESLSRTLDVSIPYLMGFDEVTDDSEIVSEINRRPELRRIMIALSQFTEQELHDLHNLFLKMMSFGDKSDK